MNFLYRIYCVLGVLACVLIAGVMLLLTGVPLLLLPKKHRWKFGIWCNVAVAWIYLHLVPFFARVEKNGLENIPRSRGFLAIANHRSAVDIPIVLVDTRAHGISKKAVLYFPFMGQLGYLGGALFFDRKSHSARRRVLREALRRMQAGQPLHIYPEGTRVREGQNVRVHLALVEFCWKSQIPVLPIALMDTEHGLPEPFILRPFQKMKVSYLPLVEPSDFENSKDFAQACWQMVQDEVVNLSSESVE